MKTTIAVSFLAIAISLLPSSSRAALLLNESFSGYANGNLVGQNGWNQLGGASTLPIQVSGGQVVIPGGQSADNQDGWKDHTAGVVAAPASGTTSVYVGMDAT